MASPSSSQFNAQESENKGALEILDILREEFSQWVDEAQNADKREALENVLRHVESMEAEYKNRLAAG